MPPETSTNAAATPEITRDKRWAKLSASGNIHDDYKVFLINEADTAYDFVCVCQPPFPRGDYEDGDDDEDEEDNDCDAGETCLCKKPASEHPDHPLKISNAGYRKFVMQRTHYMVRCPDDFYMRTFSRHENYGVVEMMQNFVLDFELADDDEDYKEQWAVCEGLCFFLQMDVADAATRVDNPTMVNATYDLIGRMILYMLAQLETQNLLSNDSEIKNLGMIMALFMAFARRSRKYGMLRGTRETGLGPAGEKKKWNPNTFDRHILAYARKYSIDLVGPEGIDKVTSAVDGNVDLPDRALDTANLDPFRFTEALILYKGLCRGSLPLVAGRKTKRKMGGDHFDITTWSSADRKAACYRGTEDPLKKKDIDALKAGMIMKHGW